MGQMHYCLVSARDSKRLRKNPWWKCWSGGPKAVWFGHCMPSFTGNPRSQSDARHTVQLSSGSNQCWGEGDPVAWATQDLLTTAKALRYGTPSLLGITISTTRDTTVKSYRSSLDWRRVRATRVVSLGGLINYRHLNLGIPQPVRCRSVTDCLILGMLGAHVGCLR